jgi:hypothetical protein
MYRKEVILCCSNDPKTWHEQQSQSARLRKLGHVITRNNFPFLTLSFSRFAHSTVIAPEESLYSRKLYGAHVVVDTMSSFLKVGDLTVHFCCSCDVSLMAYNIDTEIHSIHVQ